MVRSIVFFITMIIVNSMNAQENNSSEKLSKSQQNLVRISSLTAVGDLPQLKILLNKGLDDGLTVIQINEVLVQLYAYCGFPRSLNAINTFMTVIDERKAKGIFDVHDNLPKLSLSDTDKYERGRKILETLTKVPQAKPAPGFGEFAPRIDIFLREHLFADIFESNVLTYQERELVTISALAAMPGVESQLQSHLKIGMNTGITENELLGVAELIEKFISTTQGNSIRKLLAKPLTPIIENNMILRISEIEIIPEYLESYKAILKEESAASVTIESGVISIFPMFEKDHPNQIRIIEIYKNNAAYQSHIKSPHFQHYKTATLKMVKSLKLIDMQNMDNDTMLKIFTKMN